MIRRPKTEWTKEGLALHASVESPGASGDCFFRVPEDWADFADTERADCFLVGLLYPAMRLGEDLRVEGCVSARLLFNVNEYLVPALAASFPELNRITVSAEATTAEPGPRSAHCATGTGFSGGIDSFYTVCRRLADGTPEGFRLSHLFFFNVGAHGIPRKPGDMDRIASKFRARHERLRAFPGEVGLPFVPVDSNLHRFHPWGHLQTATLATAAAVLFLQRGIRRYYLASAGHPYPYLWHRLSEPGGARGDISFVNFLILPWLSTEKTEFIEDGALVERSEKTAVVAGYEPATRYLNVCANPSAFDTNCSVCYKCCRTMLVLELLGRLDAFSGVFDIARYRREARRLFIAQTLSTRKTDSFSAHMCALARERGVDLRREVRAIDLFRARHLDGGLHAFIRRHRALRNAAKFFFG